MSKNSGGIFFTHTVHTLAGTHALTLARHWLMDRRIADSLDTDRLFYDVTSVFYRALSKNIAMTSLEMTQVALRKI